MVKPTPQLDRRTQAELMTQLQQLFAEYLVNWKPQNKVQKGNLAAIEGVFIHFCETIIQRLNQVPDKNFLAFLDLLGADRLAPQPARVPLTFSLAGGATLGLVPAGTQVAAPPNLGEQEPVIYETERPLVVTSAILKAAILRDLERDFTNDYTQDIGPESSKDGVSLLEGKRPTTPHYFYIAHNELFSLPGLQELRLNVTFKKGISPPEANPRDSRSLHWDYWDGNQYQRLTASDSTTGLTQENGEIVLRDLASLEFKPIAIAGLERRWLRCSLVEPITIATTAKPGMVRHDQLPTITAITAKAQVDRSDLSFDAAFFNQFPIDLNKPFLPFGDRPKIGDCFYIASREGFARQETRITFKFNLAIAGIPDKTLELAWEIWNGRNWVGLIAERTGNPNVVFTTVRDQQISFTFPETPQRLSINGIENYWIRVRIAEGGYGSDSIIRPRPVERRTAFDPQIIDFQPATFTPPLVNWVKLQQYGFTSNSESIADLITENNLSQQIIKLSNTQGFIPFQSVNAILQPPPETKPIALYLGFQLPKMIEILHNQVMSLFVQATAAQYEVSISRSSPQKPQLTWQFWNGQNWQTLVVEDETKQLTRSGLITFLMPENWGMKDLFGRSGLHWLRIVWKSGDYEVWPQVRRLLTNTMLASQTVTLQSESLGVSDGSAQQKFQTTQFPVLTGQQLEVQEPNGWTEWQEVPDFYASQSNDRHYVINHLTGMIEFGDGNNGWIPPVGNLLRLLRYQTGGGDRGNRAAREIIQLKTTIPYVDRVINLEPATGGADAESLSAFMERAPLTIRHGNRAVTMEDFEDLARLASPGVARALCVPLLNLATDAQAIVGPLDRALQSGEVRPQLGEVSVIIVPRNQEVRPLPSLELIDRVKTYLEDHASPSINLSVVGPLYVSVSVTVEVVPVSLRVAGTVEREVEQALIQFLHPLTGGFDGKGWFFGRKPYRSDFYALLEAIPNVDYIHFLRIDPGDQPITDPVLRNILKTNRFLVYSGNHRISLISNLDP